MASAASRVASAPKTVSPSPRHLARRRRATCKTLSRKAPSPEQGHLGIHDMHLTLMTVRGPPMFDEWCDIDEQKETQLLMPPVLGMPIHRACTNVECPRNGPIT